MNVVQLDKRKRELVVQLKEATGIDDDNTAILRLVQYGWNLEQAIEDKDNNLTTDRREPQQNPPSTGNQHRTDETDALSSINSANELGVNGEATEEKIMTVRSYPIGMKLGAQADIEGDQRLSLYPLYDWEAEDTRKWKKIAGEKLLDRCRGVSYDYQKFNKMNFSQIEEMIAINIFGLDEKISIQALKGNNLLCAYSEEQRIHVMEVRMAMEEIAGDHILVQVIPILIRNNDNITSKKLDSHFVSVFRVQSKNTSEPDKFVDWNANIHKTWHGVLDKCPGLPKGMMVYPKNGFLREKKQTLDAITSTNETEQLFWDVCDIQFGETPQCGFLNRNFYIIKGGVIVITVASAAAMFWNPLGWTGIALTAARGAGMIAASMLLAAVDCGAEPSCSYVLSLPTFISHIKEIIMKEGIHHYLRQVAKQHRGLTAIEKIVINAFGEGFDETQIVSFVCCVFSIAQDMRKGTNKSDAVMRLVVSCQELFSCLLTPKRAERMLEEVRAELSSEELDRICSLEEKMEQLEREINALTAHEAPESQIKAKSEELEVTKRDIVHAQRKFQAMKSRQLEQVFLMFNRLQELQTKVKQLEEECHWTTNFVGKLRKEQAIRLKKDEIAKIQGEISKLQEEQMQNFMEAMDDSSAKDKFKEQVIRRCAERKCIDNNRRVIQTIFEMDAEVLFKHAAATHSTISFPSGERLNVRINDEVDISPRNVSGMAGTNASGHQELTKVMELTAGFRDGQLNEEELIERMKEVILNQEIVAKAESAKFSEWLKSCLSEEDSSLISNLSALQFRKLQKSLSSVPDEDRQFALKAAVLLAKRLKISIVNGIADCVEIVITFVTKKTDEFFKNVSDLESAGRKNEVNGAAVTFGIPENDVFVLSSQNFDLGKVFSAFLKQLGQSGKIFEKLIVSCKERIERLGFMYENCLLPSETLLFSYRQNPNGTPTPTITNTSTPVMKNESFTESEQPQQNSNEDFLTFYTKR